MQNADWITNEDSLSSRKEIFAPLNDCGCSPQSIQNTQLRPCTHVAHANALRQCHKKSTSMQPQNHKHACLLACNCIRKCSACIKVGVIQIVPQQGLQPCARAAEFSHVYDCIRAPSEGRTDGG